MVTPKRNLSSLAEPWGRSVDQRIDTLEKSTVKYQRDTDNALSAADSTARKLSEQVAAVQELTEELAAQQEILAEQQAQLTAQVSQIASLVNSQVLPSTYQANRQQFNLNTGGQQTVLSSTIPVPAGYTKALVYTNSTLTATNLTGSPDNIYLSSIINGTAEGLAARVSVHHGFAETITTAAAAYLTALGATIVVTAAASTEFATWVDPTGLNYADLATMVIFLR